MPFWGRGAGSSSNTMWPEPRPTGMQSFILIHPTVWPQYTNVTCRTDRQDRQRSDSIGQTVLQTVAQKLLHFCGLIPDPRFSTVVPPNPRIMGSASGHRCGTSVSQIPCICPLCTHMHHLHENSTYTNDTENGRYVTTTNVTEC